jgi:putative membrane protein
LSSTSSTEPKPKTRSATEILASRYRHLFVLPSAPLLLLYGGITTLLLSILSKGLAGAVTFILALVVFVLAASTISSALRIVNRRTIATFRRVLALLTGAEILWLIFTIVGAAYSWTSGSANPLTNALLFGAFICAGFEFLVINGTFEKNAPLSLVLAGIHPASTVLIIRVPELTSHLDPVATTSGVIALVLIIGFPLLLQRRKTSLGHDALALFQAFMKTWTAGDSEELEEAISDHSEEVEVTTKVLRFRTMLGDTFLVLPGVHPGPFHPVGSYDLPGVISRAFEELGPAMTLHRPGGHERNLVTRAETLKYAQSVTEFARSITPSADQAVMRGPVYAQVGNATVSASTFAADMIMTISFAPLGSDDIDTYVESELAKPASESGFDLSIVDAHNSIDPNLQSPAVDNPGWKQVFEAIKKVRSERIRAAYSHSTEIGFAGHGDLTENGIGLFMVQAETGASKCALVLADANNSVPNLRSEVATALKPAGYDLVEFCTSDSHNLAARGLTVERGYEALGEATPPASIAEAVVKMARLAESRLAPAEYGSAKLKSKVRVFGSKALEEFASITQSSLRFSRNYLAFASAAVAALLLLSILF